MDELTPEVAIELLTDACARAEHDAVTAHIFKDAIEWHAFEHVCPYVVTNPPYEGNVAATDFGGDLKPCPTMVFALKVAWSILDRA
jgi:hypothetical protein